MNFHSQIGGYQTIEMMNIENLNLIPITKTSKSTEDCHEKYISYSILGFKQIFPYKILLKSIIFLFSKSCQFETFLS